MDVPHTPADRIRTLMALNGMTQRELATRLGYSVESTVSKNLNSEDGPSLKFIMILEIKLNWSGRWIRTGEGPQQIADITSDESVSVSQPGKRNKSNVNYKGTQTIEYGQIEMAQLRTQNKLQEERIRGLEQRIDDMKRQIELLEEMNKLLKENNLSKR